MSRISAPIRASTALFCLTIGISAVSPTTVTAQDGAAKPRLELADSALRGARAGEVATTEVRRAGVSRVQPATKVATPRAAATAPAGASPSSAGFRGDFVRNQTLLGVGIYAPAFATTVARDGVAWGAGYLLVAGGSFVAAAEISRDITITDPMQHLSTWAPVQGAIAGSILGSLVDADAKGTAGAILFSSLGGTAMALWRGREMNEGEAGATVFGTNALGLLSFGAATAMGMGDTNGSSNKPRLTATLAGMVAGAPIGHAYAALAPYHVTRGDLTAMGAAAGVGMLAGLTAIADIDDPSDRQIAGAVAAGGLLGLVAGDRLLVKRYDHTLGEGRMVMLGGTAGALMGAGLALVVRGDAAEWGTLAAALTTAGAAGGIALAQRYAGPKADGAMRLGGLTLNPSAVVAAASGMRGTFTFGSIRF